MEGGTSRRATLQVSTIDLRRLRLRPGEVRREHVEVELDPFLLGGQRYEAHPRTLPVDVEITQASGATVFDLRLHAKLAGPCMRCLGYAEVEADAKAQEFHDPAVDRRGPPLRLRRRGRARRRRLGARRDRARPAGADPLPARLRRPLPRLRQGPERGAARARRGSHSIRAGPRSKVSATSCDGRRKVDLPGRGPRVCLAPAADRGQARPARRAAAQTARRSAPAPAGSPRRRRAAGRPTGTP